MPARGIGRTTVEQAEKFASAEQSEPLGRDRAHARRKSVPDPRAFAAMSAFRKTMKEISLAAADKPLNEALAVYRRAHRLQADAGDRRARRKPSRASRTWTN